MPAPPGYLPPSHPGGKAHGVLSQPKVKLSDLVGKYTDWNRRIAVAIILAESRGQVDATHTNSDGSIDRGLMQINSVHSEYDPNRLLNDPQYNVDAGHDVWKAAGGSFSPWTTFKSGAYLLYMGHDATVTPGVKVTTPLADIGSAASGIAGPVEAIAKVIGSLGNPGTWMRVGKGALGGVFIIVGVGGVVFVIANKIPTPAKAITKAIT